MKITKINEVISIKRFDHLKTCHKNGISFKGADEFIKNTAALPTQGGARDILENRELAKAYNLYNISSKINSKIFTEKIKPLIQGEYASQYNKYFELVGKDASLRSLGKKIDELFYYLSEQFLNLPGFPTRPKNALSVISKDKQMAQDVLDFLPFYMKMRAVEWGNCKAPGINKEWFMPYDYWYKNNFVRISTEESKDLSIEQMRELIYSTLKNAGENYKNTGGYTALKVDEIERIMNKDNPNDLIAWGKMYTQCSLKDYHTISLMPITNRKDLATGFDTIGRMGHPIFVLEDLGITKEDVAKLKEIQEKAQLLADKIEECFKDDNSEDVQLIRFIRRKIDEIIEEDNKDGHILDRMYQNPEKNKEEIEAFIVKVSQETEEAKKEAPFDTFKKIFEEFEQSKKPKEIIEKITPEPNEQVKNVQETVKEKTKEIIEPVKSSAFTRIKEFFKSNKKVFWGISIITIVGIAIFTMLKRNKNTVLEQQSNKINTTLLKNINFNDFINRKI